MSKQGTHPARRNSQRVIETSVSQEFADGMFNSIPSLTIMLGRSFDSAAVQLITQSWVDKHMKEQ
jgi:hypothetical protein